MMLHMDGSHHQWFQDDRWYDLIVILDDATSEIYYAQLVDDECTRSIGTDSAATDRKPPGLKKPKRRKATSFRFEVNCRWWKRKRERGIEPLRPACLSFHRY